MKQAQRSSFMFTLLLLFATALPGLAQQSKTYPLNSFNEILVSSGIDVYLTQGARESIRLVGDESSLKNVVVEKNGSSISLKYKSSMKWNFSMKNRSIKAYVTYKTLQSLRSSGGSDIFSSTPLRTDRLSISASGGSDVKLELIANEVQIHSSGGADVILRGRVKNMEIQASGGSDVSAYELITENARVNSSGGADVELHVNRALEASASGGSDITFKGNAALKNNSSKSGSVKRI